MRKRQLGKVGLRALLAAVGGLVSAALVSTVFFRWQLVAGAVHLEPRFPLHDFLADLPRQLYWMAPFMVLQALVIPLRAIQWQRALSLPVELSERYHLVAIGAFANNAVPGKLGDVVRGFLLSRTRKIPFVASIGSILVCKLLETTALIGLVALTLLGPFGGATRKFEGALRVAVPALIGLVAVVIALAHHAPALAAALERRGRLRRVQRFLSNVGQGVGATRSLRGFGALFAVSVGPVLAPAVGYGIALAAMGVPGGLFAGAIVLGAIALGQTAIGVPAGLGIYYFVTSWAARSLGASASDAAAFAALTHLSTIAANLSLGGFSLWRRKLRWADLRRPPVEELELPALERQPA